MIKATAVTAAAVTSLPVLGAVMAFEKTLGIIPLLFLTAKDLKRDYEKDPTLTVRTYRAVHDAVQGALTPDSWKTKTAAEAEDARKFVHLFFEHLKKQKPPEKKTSKPKKTSTLAH